MSVYSHAQDMAQTIHDDANMSFEAFGYPLTAYGDKLAEKKRRILAKAIVAHALATPDYIVDSPFNTERSK